MVAAVDPLPGSASGGDRVVRLPGRGDQAQAWDRSLERLERSVARYVEAIASVHDRRLRTELRELGADLQEALEVFRRAGQERGRRAAGRDDALVAAVHRAATLCAHATEAALTARQAAWRRQGEGTSSQTDAVRLLVKGVCELADSSRPQP